MYSPIGCGSKWLRIDTDDHGHLTEKKGMSKQGPLTTWLCVITVAATMPVGATEAHGGAPACTADCDLPSDKEVGINDFLALLAQWGMVGSSCDLDGSGVGINDFLLLLANWGPCPAPPNDECLDKITIDRLDSPGTIQEQFDMWGATPSADPLQCIALPAKDIWYCLGNTSMAPKNVTLSGTVDLLAEVTAGCDCANPGQLLGCERLVAAEPVTFMMQPGDDVCIRLLNDLGFPNDVINGNLIITNEPVGPPGVTCFDQPPNQSNGIFSDLDCDACAAGGNPPQQVLAEQLVLVTPELIDELRFWGGYFPADAGGGDPLPDNFTVKIRLNDDSTGVDLPGSVIRKVEIGPATTRTVTGLNLFGVREFEYTISLEPNQDLQPGFYWVEIYNDTTSDPTNDDWFWETGSLDAVNGLPGSVFSRDQPNGPKEQWIVDPVTDFALSISCKGEFPPHEIEPCDSPPCPPDTQAVWCVYDVVEVLSDPDVCDLRGIVPGAMICITPCSVPGDVADCDPDGTGIVTFQSIDNDCLFEVAPIPDCSTCPPGTPRWRRLD